MSKALQTWDRSLAPSLSTSLPRPRCLAHVTACTLPGSTPDHKFSISNCSGNNGAIEHHGVKASPLPLPHMLSQPSNLTALGVPSRKTLLAGRDCALHPQWPKMNHSYVPSLLLLKIRKIGTMTTRDNMSSLWAHLAWHWRMSFLILDNYDKRLAYEAWAFWRMPEAPEALGRGEAHIGKAQPHGFTWIHCWTVKPISGSRVHVRLTAPWN